MTWSNRWRPLLIAAAALVFAGQLPATAAEPETSPRVNVHSRDGTSSAGTIKSVEHDTLTLATDSRTVRHALADVISIEFEGHASTDQTTADRWLLFAGGDRAPLAPIDLVDDQLVCRWPSGAERANWRVPLQFITAALFQPLGPVRDGASRVPELSFRQFREDTLILRDGTRLTGVLEDLGPESIRIETAVGSVSVEAARVDAIALDAALARSPAGQENSALIVTTDGAWLTLHDWTVSAAGEVAGRTGIDTEFRAALSDIVRIACYGPQVIDLTTRTPIGTQATPFVSRVAEMLVDRNVRGEFLRVEGREYPRGFGMTSGMSATFALEPADRQFRATIGLDDMVGDDGSVVFAVELDGRRVFSSAMLRGSDSAVVVGPLDVAGGERLTLLVEFAEYGSVQDVADWCDVVVLR